ncbi:MAG: hypothetical protein IIB00_06335 [candidate division Zixibacteria bacterium]|nr:hypothetical protein [candidate division Zixibacteria bacterium]
MSLQKKDHKAHGDKNIYLNPELSQLRLDPRTPDNRSGDHPNLPPVFITLKSDD